MFYTTINIDHTDNCCEITTKFVTESEAARIFNQIEIAAGFNNTLTESAEWLNANIEHYGVLLSENYSFSKNIEMLDYTINQYYSEILNKYPITYNLLDTESETAFDIIFS